MYRHIQTHAWCERMVICVIDNWTINVTNGWLVRGVVMRERVSSNEGYIMECKAVSSEWVEYRERELWVVSCCY